jgi:hypothetical protein
MNAAWEEAVVTDAGLLGRCLFRTTKNEIKAAMMPTPTTPPTVAPTITPVFDFLAVRAGAGVDVLDAEGLNVDWAPVAVESGASEAIEGFNLLGEYCRAL